MTPKQERYMKVFEKRKQTQLKREHQICKTFNLKIQSNKLNNIQKDYLNLLFLEAKWFYNHILNSDDVFKFDTKIKTVKVLNRYNIFEERKLTILSSQLKQELHKRIITSIKGLSTKKKKGRYKEVGKLKFKSVINSIPFKQFGNSHDIISNKLKLTKCKTLFKIKGLNQLNGYEKTNGVLYKDSTGFYFKITCFKDRDLNIVKPNGIVGIDFGIKDDLVLSNGIKMRTKFPIGKDIKRNHKKLSKKKKNSKNYKKQQIKLQKSYQKLTNKKTDTKNKIVNYLNNNFNHIGIQDENIKGWHSGLFGKQVQTSIIGGIISELKKLPQTVMVDRYFPSTKTCRECGLINKLELKDRIYNCECGYIEDRDIHASVNILIESINISNLKQIPTEYRDFKPVEFNTTAINSIKNYIVSMNNETGRYNSLELC